MSEQSSAGPNPASAERLEPGVKVGGKYVIKRLLGEGANGAVYEGEHGQIGHRVAIKVVHAALAARADIVQRFEREARICATIRNRHVGQVYDVGELANGAPYMVMELHEGRSLARLLADEGPLPFSVAADVGRQLLLGLEAAHETGVIHRDVKPDNIMLVRENNGQSVVKLVDFGIGKTVHADIGARKVTQEGTVVGSPDYMPPEQLKGEAVDQRVDIYAAGVVLYEAVTGRVPFDAKSLTELFVAILRDPVKPPSALRPECPREIERVILRAMAREAGERFASAVEMREALEAAQRACGLSSDGLARYSSPPEAASASGPRPARRSLSQDYALETERVRTAELQLPVKRAGMRLALGAGGASIAAVALLFMLRAGEKAPAPEVVPRAEPASAAEPAQVAPREPNSTSTVPAVPVAPAKTAAPGPTAAPTEESATPGSPSAQPPAELPTPAAPPAEGAVAAASDSKDKAKHGRRRPQSPLEASAHPAAASVAVRAASAPASAASPAAASPAAEPVNASELLRQAGAAFVLGQMPRARALYREAVEKAPGNADGWRGLGMVSSRMGEREEAKRAFGRYLALRPGASDVEAIRKKLSEL